MKLIRYALILLLVASTNIIPAATTKTAKNAKHKKIETKQTPATKTVRSSAKDRYGKTKGEYKKMEPKKHEKGLKKPVTKPAQSVKSKSIGSHAEQTTMATKTEPTMMEKAAGWLGLGTAGTAAAKAVSTHREAGYHIGPRGWHHNFGPGWADKGWIEGTNEHGHWVFAGYRPDWWQENYPAYWKDVVGPLYRKSAEYQKTGGK
jgi:hypothetical protein